MENSINILFHVFTEEVILAEERTTEEERMHIMEGLFLNDVFQYRFPSSSGSRLGIFILEYIPRAIIPMFPSSIYGMLSVENLGKHFCDYSRFNTITKSFATFSTDNVCYCMHRNVFVVPRAGE